MKWLRDQWAKVVVEGVEGGQQGAVSTPVQAKGGGGGGQRGGIRATGAEVQRGCRGQDIRARGGNRSF